MRTILSIDDALYARVTDRAAQDGTTADRVVEEALRHYLASAGEPRRQVTLPVFEGGGGLRRGIDPSSNTSLRRAAGLRRIDDMRVDELR